MIPIRTLVFAWALLPAFAFADSKPPIEIGKPAPEFPVGTVDQDNQPITLGEYKGKRIVVLYFYPWDDTPGCTAEAKGFTADRDRYDALGAVVLGVSDDDAASHKEFIDSYKLKVRLVADPNEAIIDRWGALNFLGMANRATFLIDKSGIVRRIFPDVDPDTHSKEVLEAIEALNASPPNRD